MSNQPKQEQTQAQTQAQPATPVRFEQENGAVLVVPAAESPKALQELKAEGAERVETLLREAKAISGMHDLPFYAITGTVDEDGDFAWGNTASLSCHPDTHKARVANYGDELASEHTSFSKAMIRLTNLMVASLRVTPPNMAFHCEGVRGGNLAEVLTTGTYTAVKSYAQVVYVTRMADHKELAAKAHETGDPADIEAAVNAMRNEDPVKTNARNLRIGAECLDRVVAHLAQERDLMRTEADRLAALLQEAEEDLANGTMRA